MAETASGIPEKKKAGRLAPPAFYIFENGAGEGARTLGLDLGKVAL